MGLVAISIVSPRLQLTLATTGFFFVILIVLVSVAGSPASSIAFSIMAAFCMFYIAAARYTARIAEREGAAVVTFLVTSIVIAGLVSRLRMMMEGLRSSVNRRLIDAEERERARIARELHDDISQRMALLAINMDKLKQVSLGSANKLHEQIDEISHQAKALGEDVNAVSHRLHSSKLDLLGLALAADGFCREISDRQHVEIEFHSENVPRNLPVETSICLYRVLQEAVQNAISHSGSRTLQVSLKGDSIGVELLVRDSGSGFDPDEALKGHGLGLTSMRERLRMVNGDLFIDSALGRGTTIHARVPLHTGMNSEEEAE